jgi:outer membrane lipoprotein-sorting protein
MRKAVIIIMFITFINVILPIAHAVESSPSADIKAKLEELKKEIASKAAKLKQIVNRSLTNKAYVGKVKTKSATSLTLAVRSGAKIVSLNQDTVFESEVKSKQKFSAKTISEEDFLAALGDIDETGVLTAKKIELMPESIQQTKKVISGTVNSIDDGTLNIKDKELKNYKVSIDKNTDLITAEKEILLSQLKSGQQVLVVGFLQEENLIEATFVYMFTKLQPQDIKKGSATDSSTLPSPSKKPEPKID